MFQRAFCRGLVPRRGGLDGVEIFNFNPERFIEDFSTETDGRQHGWRSSRDAGEKIPMRGRIEGRVERNQRQADPSVLALRGVLPRQFKYASQIRQGPLLELLFVPVEKTGQVLPRRSRGRECLRASSRQTQFG